MATKELQLISRIISTGDLNSVIDWGISIDDFVTSECRGYYAHLTGYHARAATLGSVPGLVYFKNVFPNFQKQDDPGMTLDSLCHEVRKERIDIEFNAALDAAKDLGSSDQELSLVSLQNELARLQTLLGGRTRSGMSIDSGLILARESYDKKKSGFNPAICSWPWKPLNDETMGIQPDDYIVVYGRPKSFKSWIIVYLIYWVYTQGKTAVIYTKEMTAETIYTRIVACMAGLDYKRFRLAQLTEEEECDYEFAEAQLRASGFADRFVCFEGKDAPEGGDTVPWLRSKVEQLKPDVVFVDGMYLMSDVNKSKDDHARVRSISRAIRQTVMALKIPFICTIQANRAAAKNNKANTDEIGFSDAIGQDATLVIRTIIEKSNSTCQLVIGAAREFDLAGFRINAIPATNFSFHSLLTDKEITDAKIAEDKDPKVNVALKTAKSNGHMNGHATEASLVDSMLKDF